MAKAPVKTKMSETQIWHRAIGSIIREARERNLITLKDLSEATKLSISTLSKIENGKQDVSIRNLLKISNGLCSNILILMNRTFYRVIYHKESNQ